MYVELFSIDRLVPYVRTLRKNDPAIERMMASINEFGFKIPILARSTGEVVDGHLRLKAAKKLGMPEVPVILCDEWSETQVKAFRLLVNRSATWAEWDVDLVGLELGDLKAIDFDLDLTGFDPVEIDGFLFDSEKEDSADVAPPLPVTPASRLGDLWICGEHRLLCGDATSNADVDRLMAGEAADLVFTDLPYNVDYEGYTEDRLTITGDRMTPEQFRDFLSAAFTSYRRTVKPGASLYVCHSSSWQREFQNAMESAGFEVRCQIIWAKNTFAWGFGRYKFQHEPIFYAHVAEQKDAWYGDKSQSTLWQENKPAANRIHPTAKPVELVDRALINSSMANDIVADLFGGSGSTLIACERRGRRARLMEIDPRYADCMVRRWREFTGKEVRLEGDGRGFEEVSASRVSKEDSCRDQN